MKLKIFLLLSVTLNAGALGYFFVVKKAPPPTVEAAPVLVTNIVAAPERPAEPRTLRAEQPAAATNDFHWSQLESQDYRDYIARLRAVGCPEETIRDIIIADVNKLYAPKMAALYPSPMDFKFWQVEEPNRRGAERERDQKRRELEREKSALIRELLGVDYEAELAKWSGRPDEDAYRYGFLSAEKQASLRTLQDKYREMERAIWGEGGNTPENRAKLTALRAQRESEMAQLLGPQDFQEYQLRNSWTSRNMRENLASFQPTEDEFRKIFELRKAFDDQFGFTRDGGDEAAREQRRLAQAQLDEQLRATLGEDRYRNYQLAQDDRYRELHEFTQRNNLPAETAMSVYEMRRTAEAMRRQVETDQSLTPEQRTAALTALANETRTAVSSTLGEQAWNSYQRRDGDWIGRLSRTQNEPRGGGDDGRGGRGRRGG